MICSLWRFDFLNRILLEHEDWMLDQPEMPVSGQVQQSIRPGLVWGQTFGRGNRLRSIRWSRVLEFDTPEERLGFEMAEPALAPVGESGTLSAEIKSGASFEIADFTLLSCNPEPDPLIPTRLYLRYEGEGGEMTITDRGGLGGLGWEEIETNWTAIGTTWAKL